MGGLQCAVCSVQRAACSTTVPGGQTSGKESEGAAGDTCTSESTWIGIVIEAKVGSSLVCSSLMYSSLI